MRPWTNFRRRLDVGQDDTKKSLSTQSAVVRESTGLPDEPRQEPRHRHEPGRVHEEDQTGPDRSQAPARVGTGQAGQPADADEPHSRPGRPDGTEPAQVTRDSSRRDSGQLDE